MQTRFWRESQFGALVSLASTALAVVLLAPFRSQVGLLNAGLSLLLLTLVVSAAWGWAVGVLTAILTNLALNYFFVEPLHRLSVNDPKNLAGLLIFLVVSLVGGSLLALFRRARAETEARRVEAEIMLDLTRRLIGESDPGRALSAMCQEALAAFECRGVAILGSNDSGWETLAWAGDDSSGRAVDATERSFTEKAVIENGVTGLGYASQRQGLRPRIVGRSGRQAVRQVTFVPLKLAQDSLGVLRLDGALPGTLSREQQERLLGAFAREAALTLQRARLARVAALADALKQADEVKSTLLAAVSHDLRTPLAGIKAAVSSLLDPAVDWSEADQGAFLHTIDAQVDLLNHLIKDVLDMSRLDSGAVHPTIQALSVSELFATALSRVPGAGVDDRIEVDAPAGLEVLADEGLIVQSLVNLLENAIKYAPAGSRIRMGAESDGEGVVLSVEDEGPGIRSADLPFVFKPFFRSRQNAPSPAGSGLGLAIVKGFVELSGGQVTAANSESGARFTISLPRAEAVALPT